MSALVLVTGGCGPTSRGDDDDGGNGNDGGTGADADINNPPPPPVGVVSGVVWAPGNAPGMVPPGHEIPIAGAVVYVTEQPPPSIPAGVYCDPCQDNPPGSTLTNAKGEFTLIGITPGARRLVIEKAQFRLEQMVEVAEEIGVALPVESTTLPSVHDPANGKWIPRVAIAVADSDHVEDIFGKMKILGIDDDGRALEDSFDDNDRVELYGNPGNPPFVSKHKGTIGQLFGNLATMSRYHIIFVPCNFYSDVSQLSQPAFRQNIKDYVAAGGKIYVTDWSSEWEDAAFPEFITFDVDHDTTPALASSGTINPGDGDFGHFAMHASADDSGLASWLDGQTGPVVIPLGGEAEEFPSEYQEGTIDAADFVIEGAWNLIRGLPAVPLGNDENGQPVSETAKVWISGDYMGQTYPHTVTFEPSCGRVLYSTYHTAQQTHLGLVPQERVLLYLILEIGVCNDGPIIE